ncbi:MULTISPECIES: formyltetrahydrofolate deformylase [Helicobacter]|uniref:Formyltetrahydrofolate deformylase n=1 Tax=Helicobacter ibis TaxID=2962633 RepID=A0ABT4VF15_9HELI|nr:MULTISPECIES: formyltetrahydrofolate deformylase [Helicobacter]MDA3966622.1 formyltetrahydrofolate deformylase [Helicobacter sp. WB40]MDA3968763.1 formyltetrahydrofolate deformylase [Helicobacter ibis]
MQYVLKITTKDEKGLISKITAKVLEFELNILQNDEFVDKECNLFFMRSLLEGGLCEDSKNKLKESLVLILGNNACVEIIDKVKKDIVILGTKENHCLGDLLIRYDSGELNCNIKAIISNHQILETLSEKFNIPYIFISSDNISREEHELKVIESILKYPCNYIVLAKYMRVLTPNFVKRFEGKIINIHHSFLPAFVGANPYKQAYNRGVKIIGATAHFVNNELDEGPIIEQDTIKVNHTMSWQDMQRHGRDVEKVVLARALNLVLEERVFVYNNKTIVF